MAVRVLPRGFDDPALQTLTTAEVLASPDLRTAEDGAFEVTADRDAALVFAGKGRCTVVVRRYRVSEARDHQDLGLVILPRAGARIGTVHDAAGEPIAGARVTARGGPKLAWLVDGTEHRFWSAVLSGVDGRFVLEGVPRFALDVEVSAPGRYTAWQNLLGEGDALTFELSPSRIVAGRLVGGGVGHSGELWLRALYASYSVPRHHDWIAVDSEGRFRFTLRAESSVRLIGQDRRTGIAWTSGVVEPGALEAKGQEVEVLPEVLRDAEGAPRAVEVVVAHAKTLEPVVGAEVWANLASRQIDSELGGYANYGREIPALVGRTDESGIARVWAPYRSGSQFPLPVTVRAPDQHLRVASAAIEFADPRIELKLGPEVTAKVQVVDAGGQPLGEAGVFWTRHGFPARPSEIHGRPQHVAVTGSDGWCHLDGMPPGELELHAWHPELPLSASKVIGGVVGTERKWSIALPPTRRLRVRIPPELRGARVLVMAGIDRAAIAAVREEHGGRFHTEPMRTAITDLEGWAVFEALPDLPTRLAVARTSRLGVPRMVLDLLGTVPDGGDAELAFAAHGADERCRVRGRIESAHPDVGNLLVSTLCIDESSRFQGSKSVGPALGGGLFDVEVVPGTHRFQVLDLRTGILLYEREHRIEAERDPEDVLALTCEVVPVRLLVEVAAERRAHGALKARNASGSGTIPVELTDGRCTVDLALPEGSYRFDWVQRFRDADSMGPPPAFSPSELDGLVDPDAGRRDGRQEILLRF